AETVGLVVGVVGLATLFEDAVRCFEIIRLGVSFERNFTTCQLRLEDTRARLCRWGRAVDMHDNEVAKRLLGLDKFGQTEKRLKLIKVCFDEAEKICQDYSQGEPEPEPEPIGPNPDLHLPRPAANIRRTLRNLYPLPSGKPGVIRRTS
ncbi:hypothetical protein CC78DRAFT_475109, partial [Lojkania enalia]